MENKPEKQEQVEIKKEKQFTDHGYKTRKTDKNNKLYQALEDD